MTKVKVNPGVCGMECNIEVSKIDRMNYSVKVDSKCQMVMSVAEKIVEVNLRDVMKKYGENVVAENACGVLAHATCPVPTGILKAIEAEAGMALKRDASITFVE